MLEKGEYFNLKKQIKQRHGDRKVEDVIPGKYATFVMTTKQRYEEIWRIF